MTKRFNWQFAITILQFAIAFTLYVPAYAEPPKPDNNPQDFVFLAESRPLLVRMHVRVDGKPLQAAWDEFMKKLFAYLDVNGDDILNKDEAERAPAAETILTGGITVGLGGAAMASPGPDMNALDADKDGKVTRSELSAYYLKNGLAPFQFQLKQTPANPLGAYFGGAALDPAIDVVSERAFRLLDRNKDGKLSKEELAAAPSLFLKLDENGDELITAAELVPDAKAPADMMAAMSAMTRNTGKDSGDGNEAVIPVTTSGEAPANLVRRLQERYGPKSAKPEEKKLTRKDVALDNETFARLDADKDGLLSAAELVGFVKCTPDLELIIDLRRNEPVAARVAIKVRVGDKAEVGRVTASDGSALLDLSTTRIELRGSGEQRSDGYANVFRQQGLGQLKQIDTDNNGYIDEKEAKSNRMPKGLFKAADRDGDGKLTEKELNEYFDRLAELQSQAAGGCVCLVLTDESRGIFDLLDTSRDGRLGLRELRQAPALLAQLDRDKKGWLTKTDVPRSYRLTLRRGPADAGGVAGIVNIFSRTYSYTSTDAGPSTGPLWFRKLDRNRDGDVSRKEFIGSDEDFRRIDTDGDGLISIEEATKADERLRKEVKDDE